MKLIQWFVNKMNDVTISIDKPSFEEADKEVFLITRAHQANQFSEILSKQFPFYKTLSAEEQKTLENLIEKFQAEKKFLFYGKVLRKHEDLKLLTSALICRIALKTKEDFFSELETIHIYHTSFLYHKTLGVAQGLAASAKINPQQFENISLIFGQIFEPILDIYEKFPLKNDAMKKSLNELSILIKSIQSELTELRKKSNPIPSEVLTSSLGKFLQLHDNFTLAYGPQIQEIFDLFPKAKVGADKLSDMTGKGIELVQDFLELCKTAPKKRTSNITLTIQSIMKSLYLPESGNDICAHEMGHIIDFKFGVSILGESSESNSAIADWKKLWINARTPAQAFTDPSVEDTRMKEEFAECFELFFSRPSDLKKHSARKFHAIETLIGYVPQELKNNWIPFITGMLN